MLIKKRKAKISERGIYIQDKELLETAFLPGVHYKYIVDHTNKTVTIQPAESGNMVSKRRRKDMEMSVIDIRKQEVKEIFTDTEYMEIEIYEDEIRVTGMKRNDQGEEIAKTILLSRQEFQEFIREQGIREYPTVIDEALTAVSVFSGAGVFDIGFHEEFQILRSLDIDKDAARTYRYNFGNHIAQDNVLSVDRETIPEVDLLVGGSPCQGFSNANRRTNVINNPNNLLIREFIRMVKCTNCKVFVLENVPQVLTAGNGQFVKELKSALSAYRITTGVLNASHFGTAQNRKRAFVMGSKIGDISLPIPKQTKIKTVEEAFVGLHDDLPNQLDYTDSSGIALERMKHIPQGGNVMDIPEQIRPKGTHSINYRRLRFDEVSPSIVHVGKSNILHPTENRNISVRETARLFDVPDSFVFKGALRAMQQQIANSVPVSLGRAIARKVKETFSRKLIYF